MPTLCGPDVLQKNSIERSVPKAEWSVVSFWVLFADQKVPMASL
jgi:hypothetical protein